ncbi:tetraspanin-18-like [Haliotis rubra]|uniref:tetraspanin-18-like n=1 Tax=Haliotis rubra TaxID=36100 RepID=UPI001EE50338|nr:tetraspanin-18-like [Haliotis rubra]XP_046565391.1 tetraspanin-18-like [Haliotis rubra]
MCQVLSVIGRILIGLLSLVFTIIGLAILAAGVMVKVQSPYISGLLESATAAAEQQASTATGSSTTFPEIDLSELLGGLATAFIVLGVVMMAIGIFGLVGACCMVKCVVICYLVIVSLLFVSQLTLILILVINRGLIVDYPRNTLKTTLQQEYQGVNGTDVTSLALNVLMVQLECCGINNGSDFDAATKWQTTFGMSSPILYMTPVACCKAGKYTGPPTGDDCAKLPTDVNSNFNKGCYDSILDFVLKGDTFIIFACVDVGGLFLLVFFSAVMLHEIIKKENKVWP